MGNNASSINQSHLRIYSNIIQIKNPQKRVQMISTCLAGTEYIESAKRAGIYSYLLNYISSVKSGQNPSLLPGEQHDILQSSPNVPRAFQPPPQFSQGIGATHPSLINRQDEGNGGVNGGRNGLGNGGNNGQLTTYNDDTPSWRVVANTPKQKAMTYFASCLEVLGIQEEVALTQESLKSSYKRVALKAHPDKGGSEEYFEAVTRAYAYLSEILKHIKGGRKDVNGKVDAPSSLSSSRDTEAEKWKHTEPVRLNAKNLDMNAFNKLFEETHMPDPDSDGYGDWLKNADGGGSGGGGGGPKFKGQFNRDVFNKVFEDEARRGGNQQNSSLITHPGQMALTLNPMSGVDLVGDRPDSYTAAPNSKFQFTDLRGAYTTENTISEKVSSVRVDDRNFEQYRAGREKAPDPFTTGELQGIRDFEMRQKQQDELRERKRGEMHVRNQQYFDRMKQMVITDGIDQNQKKLTY
jgi:curved DNA-binding protein CbpA